MKTLVLWRWRYRDPARGGRLTTTRHMLTEDDARVQLPPDAERLDHTREERRVPDTDAERDRLRTGRLMGDPSAG